jgi:hypothetical protein
MMNKALHIIGNGVDLHHGFKTSYKKYLEHLKPDRRYNEQ